jgi:trigger factor
MNAVVERAENSEVTLKVEVEPEQLTKATDRAYQRLVQRVNIPGFRRGKAPRKILERAVGTDALYREALDFVMPSAYQEAVRETGILPITQPSFEVVELDPEKPLIFKAIVPVQPTVKLGDWKSIKVEPESWSVTDEELDEAVQNIRNSQGQWVPVDNRALRVGDQATIDVVTTLEGAELSPTPREMVAELNAESAVPSWANRMAGMRIGDSKDIDEEISADYQSESIAGKTATYHVTVKSIKARVLPDVDDDMARAAGDYEDLEALKKDLRERLETRKKAEAKERYENDLVAKLADASEIEFPHVMVHQETDQMLRETDMTLRRQGISLDMFLRASNKNVDELREEWEPGATRRIRHALVLRQLIQDEKLELDPAKLEAALARMVRDATPDQRAQIADLVNTDRVRDSVADELLLREAVNLLDRSAGGEQFVESDSEEGQ